VADLDLASRTHRHLLIVVGVLLVVTLVGMVLLWPRADRLPETSEPLDDLVSAEILDVEVLEGEGDPELGLSSDMLDVTVEIRSGPDAGEIEVIRVSPDGYPEFRVGDRVELQEASIPGDDSQYFIVDFSRLPTLLLLGGIFVLAVIVVSRWQGLRSLVGLALSLLIIIRFIVPSILSGQNPPLVALVGATAIMIVTLYLAHGVNEMTTSAVVGTGAALVLTIGLALAFIDRAKITGWASEEATFARMAVEGLDLQGLVLAGLIIATLGVLDDVTVSQASTVFALHDTDRRLSWSVLFARAMKVGRDHIASVVNTLFLAYAGASLALLVLFSTSGVPALELTNSEVIAEEIVKTVIGSLGLITAVPLTTALAAAIAVRRPPDAPPTAGGHLHGHGAAAVAPAVAAGPGLEAGGSRRPSPGDDVPQVAPSDGPDGPGESDESDEARAERAWARYLRENPPPSSDD
jgi:uncharacterized membrane protein